MAQAPLRRVEQSGVHERLPTPLYHQIYVILRDKIYDGSHADEALLPGEQELMRMFGVSRITAKRALDELAAAGLAVRERGRGTRVRFQAPSPPIRSSAEGLFENLLMMGLKTEVQLLEFGYVKASDDVARALQIESGDVVQRAVRVRRLKGEPFSYLTTAVPEHIGRSYGRRDLASRPLLALLERCGVVVSSAEQVISPVLADTRVAPLLEVELGSALLRISRIVYDQLDHPVEYIIGLYRPDRYQYQMMLSRVQAGNHNKWSPVAEAAGLPSRRGSELTSNREKKQ